MAGGVLAALAALVGSIVIAFSIGSPASSHGCIHLVLPAATGAQELNQCGAAARVTCASVKKPGTFTANAARSAVTECRKAGIAVGGHAAGGGR
jgi:hypothetical protein